MTRGIVVDRRDDQSHVLGGEVLLLVDLHLLGRREVTAQWGQEPRGVAAARGAGICLLGIVHVQILSPRPSRPLNEWMSSVM